MVKRVVLSMLLLKRQIEYENLGIIGSNGILILLIHVKFVGSILAL